MFSRDPKHNRPTPRTIQQEFGPYADFKFQPVSRRQLIKERIYAGVGVAVVGIILGGMAWLGMVL
jgi:hypothetical protein